MHSHFSHPSKEARLSGEEEVGGGGCSKRAQSTQSESDVCPESE